MERVREKLRLPAGYKLLESFGDPSFRDGDYILSNYCAFCVKKPNCEINEILRHAMGDNFPFWAEEFVAVDGKDFCETMLVCTDYESPQFNFEFKELFSDGVEKLIEIVEGEECLAEV